MNRKPEGLEGANEVLCIVVTYNSGSHIMRCLDALGRQSQPVRVLVYDNASADETVDLIESSSSRSHVEISSTNIGFSAAVNAAAERNTSHTGYFLLLNPDVVLHEGAIASLVQFARRNRHAGLWGGLTLTPEGEVDPGCCLATPNLWHAMTYGFGLSRIPGVAAFWPDSLGGWNRTGDREVPVLTATFLLVESILWRDLDGFDERYFMYGEDVDLCMRARRLGRHPMYTDRAACTHVGGASSRSRADHLVLLLTGRATLYQTYARPARLALAMLKLGTALRAVLESKLRPGEDAWREAWRRRDEWEQGWPSDRLSVPSTVGAPSLSSCLELPLPK